MSVWGTSSFCRNGWRTAPGRALTPHASSSRSTARSRIWPPSASSARLATSSGSRSSAPSAGRPSDARGRDSPRARRGACTCPLVEPHRFPMDSRMPARAAAFAADAGAGRLCACGRAARFLWRLRHLSDNVIEEAAAVAGLNPADALAAARDRASTCGWMPPVADCVRAGSSRPRSILPRAGSTESTACWRRCRSARPALARKRRGCRPADAD